jgi:hypothetical protein
MSIACSSSSSSSSNPTGYTLATGADVATNEAATSIMAHSFIHLTNLKTGRAARDMGLCHRDKQLYAFLLLPARTAAAPRTTCRWGCGQRLQNIT